MYQRLPSQEKIRFIKRVQAGEPVTKVCREAGISRTIFYQWLKKYQQAGPRAKKTILASKVVRGKKHWRRLSVGTERKILKTALKHPSFSPQKISEIVDISPHGVWNALKRNGLNTQTTRETYICQYGSSLIKPPTIDDKLTMIRRFETGEDVAYICREFGISRTTFYKWFKRYLKAPEENKKEILASWRPEGEKHWRFVPEAKELVLSIVVDYPELSPQKIAQKLPLKADKPILGNHGVYNLLKRLNLNTYERRLVYAQSQIQAITPVFGLPERIRRIIGKIPLISAIPPPAREKIASVFRAFVVSLLTSTILSTTFIFWLKILSQAPTTQAKLGLFFASVSLLVGGFFFAYSMKYYLTLAIVLSFSRQPLEEGGGIAVSLNGRLNGNQKNGNGWLARIFGLSNGNGNGKRGVPPAGGLQPSLEHIKLKRFPFISIHLPFYNEKKVAERILKACTLIDYPKFEIIICDDSTDETTEIVQRYAKEHNQAYPDGPKIKILHRPTREGFKGGALRHALEHIDPRAEFVVVFDADFIPYPDTLELFIKYYKANNGNSENYTKNNIACVAGYQWHVLNKSENWITRGVRTEYAGSYVIERPGQEILGAMKLIHGSVYAIRADILKKFGWGTSITEDFELTLRLYAQGYKVIYTPYIQGPAECVSTIKRLIRQRMRWAEGHSHNVRKMAVRLLSSPNMTLTEKLEFLYLSPYYLQAFFFLVGTFSWLLAETVFRARLPFWTSLWGWSLVLTNFFALPLVNAVGLFLEEAEEKDYLGIFSFIALSYLLVPFQAYASIKGFLEKEEGPWFRTPKTGLITDIFTRGRFYRWISGILPGRGPAPALARNELRYSGIADFNPRPNPYLALVTANNQFSNFKIRRRHIRWVGNLVLSLFVTVTILISSFAPFIPVSSVVSASETTLKTIVGNKSQVEQIDNFDPQNPPNKDLIIKNALAKEIESPRGIRKATKDEKVVEFIFHNEPRVRVKLDGSEIEFETIRFGGKRVNPKRSKIFQDKEVVYEDIVPQVDLRYTLSGDLLVEEFIVKDRSVFESFDGVIEQSFRTIDTEIVSPDPSSFGFYSEDGKELFKFAAPFAQDSKGERTVDLQISLEKQNVGYKLVKSFGSSAKKWLVDENRVYPVSIDPSVIVSGGIEESDVNYGGLQRKVAYVNGNWYAFYNCDQTTCTQPSSAGKIFYKKSSDGATWGSPVDVDSSDSDNYNPSIDVSGNFIIVFWVDTGSNFIEGKSIDTGTGDALTGICQSASQGTLASSFMVTVAAFSTTSVLVAYSDTSTDTEVDIFRVTAITGGTCTPTFNDVHPGNITFGTQGSGLTSSDRPVVVPLSSTVAVMVFQDAGDLSFAYFDAGRDEWRRNNQTIASVTDNVYSVTTDGTSVWVLTASGGTAVNLYSYPAANTGVVETATAIDADIGGATADTQDSGIDMDCISATDCKIVYIDALDTTAPILMFVDCDNADCSTKTSTNIDSDVGGAAYGGNPRIFCPATDNCKIVYGDMAVVAPDAVFVDCGDATCSGTAGTCTSGTRTCTIVDTDLGAFDTEFYGDVFCPSDVSSDTDCKFIFFNSEDETNDAIWFADCSNASCGTRDALTSIVANMNDDIADAQAPMSLYCNASADCQVLFHDAVNGDLTLRDCSNSSCSTADATTDIDLNVGANVAGAQSVSVPNAIDCSPGATDCKIVYADGSQNEVNFVDCNAAGCTSSVITKIDDTAGGIMGHDVSLFCVTATDCKGTFVGNTTGGSEDIYMFDCDNADCTAGSVVDLSDPPFMSAIDCVGGTSDCKLVYYDIFVSTTDVPVRFADCTNENCLPDWTDEADPWTGQTGVETVSLTLDTANNLLYANVIMDASDQAYYKTTSKSSIFWGGQTSWQFSAGTLNQISSPMTVAADTQMGVVVQQTNNYEFSFVPERLIYFLITTPFWPKIFSRLKIKKKRKRQ